MFAVIKTGGKQYLIKENDEIIVDKIKANEKDKIELVSLAAFDDSAKEVELGKPFLTKKIKADVVSQLKGDKIRVAKFKAKVRYRKVMGFRQKLTKLKITKI